jgi:hypothetical protein
MNRIHIKRNLRPNLQPDDVVLVNRDGNTFYSWVATRGVYLIGSIYHVALAHSSEGTQVKDLDHGWGHSTANSDIEFINRPPSPEERAAFFTLLNP